MDKIELKKSEIVDEFARDPVYAVHLRKSLDAFEDIIRGKVKRELSDDLFYIQDSRQYVGNAVLWWAKGNSGYTTHISDAGIYSREEAIELCEIRLTDRAWPKELVDRSASLQVDIQQLRRLQEEVLDGEVKD